MKWNEHRAANIIGCLKDMPYKICNEDDFSVPDNPRTKVCLIKFVKVLIEKIKECIETSLQNIKFSGLELEFAKKIFVELSTKQSIQ